MIRQNTSELVTRIGKAGSACTWSGGEHRHSLSYQEEVKAVQNHTVTKYVFGERLCDSICKEQ